MEEEKNWWALAVNDKESRILHCTKNEMHDRSMFLWSSLSCRYETKEELIKEEGIPDEPCRECGQIFSTNYQEDTKANILKDNICFTCYFWKSKLSIKDDPCTVRINGVHYFIGDNNSSKHAFKGFGGREFNIRFNDGRLVTTCNLWCQGDISDHFKERLPDNATFVEVKHTKRDEILEKLIPNAKDNENAE